MQEYFDKGMTQQQVLDARPDIRNPYSLQLAMQRTGIMLVDDRPRKTQRILTDDQVLEIYDAHGQDLKATIAVMKKAGYQQASARRLLRRMHDDGLIYDESFGGTKYVKSDFELLKEKLISNPWRVGICD
jgi:hypothetical protein